MGDDALTRLEDAFGTSPPDGVAGLAPEDLADLARALEQARRRQSADLHEAMRRSLDHIPGLLRGPVRKLLLG